MSVMSPAPPPRQGPSTLRRASLTALRGPVQGSRYPLDGETFVLGRGDGCDLQLADPAISRKHLELKRSPGGWMVTDLGSGNGSGLNGERISGETLLQSGDILIVGDSQLRFELEGRSVEPPPTRRHTDEHRLERERVSGARHEPRTSGRTQRPPSRTGSHDRARRSMSMDAVPTAELKRLRFILVGALIFGVLPLSAGIAVFIKHRRQEQALEQVKNQAATDFERGKGQLERGQWDEAKASLLEAARLDPNLPVQPLVVSAVREKENDEHFTQARLALVASELNRAASELSRVRADTQQTDRMKTLQDELRRKADERIFDAQKALEKGDVTEASRLATEVLGAIPTHDGAHGVLLKVSQWKPPASAKKEEVKAAAAPTKKAAAKKKSKRSSKR